MKRCVVRFATANKPSFEMVRSGRKTVETRAATARYRGIEVGDLLVFICGVERFEKPVKQVMRAQTPEAFLQLVDYRAIRPDADSPQAVIEMWYAFPGYREKIAQDGLIGFEV